MPYRLKIYPRRFIPLYHRDLLGTDALFRLNQKEILKVIKTLKNAYQIMNRIGGSNVIKKARIK